MTSVSDLVKKVTLEIAVTEMIKAIINQTNSLETANFS
jgi:hypothetical protein